MTKQLRNRGWLAVLTFATLFAPQVVIAQNPVAKDSRPMLFGFMVDGRMVQARVVGGEVTATVTPAVTRAFNTVRRSYINRAKGQSFPKDQMKVSKGLVRFMDKEGNVAAELTHWKGGGNLTVAPRKVPVRLGISLSESKTPGGRGRVTILGGRQVIPVDEVAADGPADKAGMKSGDLIVEINGQKLVTEELLLKVLKGKKPGDPLKLGVIRDGKELEVTAKLEAVPEKLNPYSRLISGRLDPIISWRRGQFIKAKRDVELLAVQQAALQALLGKQAAKIRKEAKKNGAWIGPKSTSKGKQDANDRFDVFLRIQSELKKSSEKAGQRKKELDAKLEELRVEEARQKAVVWFNRANQRRGLPLVNTLLPGTTTPREPGQSKKSDPVRGALDTARQGLLQSLLLVDPKLTSKSKDSDLSKQVSDLEKRLMRMEKLLEESLSRQREADRRESEARNLRNRKNEIDAKIRELKRAEAGEAKKDRDNTDVDRQSSEKKPSEKKLGVRKR